jgi:putative ABC transport system permease protein
VALTNLLRVEPAEGVGDDAIRTNLFEMEGVSSVQSVGAVADSIRDLLNEFVVVLRVVEGAMLLIALLIAFNSSSINMDERTREHATMFAFGVPVRRVMGMAMLESLMLGIISTAVGLLVGWLLLNILMETRIATTMPDISMTVTLSRTTVAITLFFGVMMVTLAPLLNGLKLRSMDIPAKLKVME